MTGRIGIAVNQFLPYIKAGYASAEVETRGAQTAIGDAFNISDWEHGWAIGGGVEFKFGNNLIVGAEYNYIDLGGGDRTGTANLGLPFTLTDVHSEIHAVTARISYKFGRRHATPVK